MISIYLQSLEENPIFYAVVMMLQPFHVECNPTAVANAAGLCWVMWAP